MQSESRRNLSFFLFLIFFSGLLFFFDRFGWLGGLRSFFASPFLSLEKKIHGFQAKSDGELTDWQEWAVDQNQLISCLSENEKMRRLLGAPLPPSWKFLPASVINVNEKMLLDKGKAEGVELGMAVVFENILVGRVSLVHLHSSLIQLVRTPGTKIPVVVKRPNQAGILARGLLVSQTAEQMLLDKVLLEEDIRANDLVVTNGQADWANNLLIGTVGEVLSLKGQLFQRAQIKPLLDYQNLETVFLVIKQ